MKQIEYTEKQKEVIDILEPFKKLAKCRFIEVAALKNVISVIEAKYEIEYKYSTLREFLKEHSVGAYHRFKFKIMNVEIDVIGIDDFKCVYKEALLDKYFVISDNKVDNGGNCENYECIHNLELELITND